MALNYSQLNWFSYCEMLNLSDADIANEIGVSPDDVWSFRHGTKKPEHETAVKFAAYIRAMIQAKKAYHEQAIKSLQFQLIGVEIFEKHVGVNCET